MYRKSKRGRTLVGKGGRITKNSKKNVENFIDELKRREDLSDAEKTALIADVHAYVDAYHQSNMKLTTTGFFGHYETDKITRMLTNAGYTPEELADEIGVTEEEILDKNNWSGDIFMGVWQLQFNYTGEILKYVGPIRQANN